jgi:GT2 family glycosyltransferase
MSLKILTLNWNGLDKLTKLRDSLIPNLEGIDWTWHIKDNGSKDGSPEEISTWHPNIVCDKYAHNNDNFSQGMNRIFKLSEPDDKDLILLLNNDVIFNDKISLKKMIKLFNSNNSIGAVGAKLLNLNSNIINHAGVVFNETNGFPMHFRSGQQDDNLSKLDREFQAVTGAVFLTRADIYKEAGMLPEQMRWAFDDIYFSLSIKYNLKKKIVMAGDVSIFHEESATLKKNPVNKLHMNHNMICFHEAWHNKYTIDLPLYTKNKNYNLFKK